MAEEPTSVIALIRVSAKGQRDKFGPEVQRKETVAKATNLGWNIVDWWEYQESAVDPDNRPKFTNTLNDLVALGQAGSIKGVLFAHPDRLGRDGPMAFFHYVYLLRQLGKLEIRFAQEDIDPDDRHYEDDLFDAATSAQRDAKKIKRRTVVARRTKAERGEMPSGSKEGFLWTYNRNTRKRELHPERSQAFRLAIDLVLAGTSLRSTVRQVEAETSIRLPLSTLRNLMHNPAICGKTVSRWNNEDGTVTEIPLPGVTPAICTESEFDLLCQWLESTKKWYGKQKGHYYPLSGMYVVPVEGMVVCSLCGCALCGNGQLSRGVSRRYYSHRKNDCQTTYKNWPSHKLEALVWDKLLDYFADPEEAKRKLSEQISGGRVGEVLEMELKHLEEQDTAAQSEKTRLTRSWARGRMEDDAYESDISKIEAQEAARVKRRKEIHKSLQDMKAVDFDALSKVIDNLAAQSSSPWELFPSDSAAYDDVGSYHLGEYQFDDGRVYAAINPDHPTGKAIWEKRREILRQFGVRVHVTHREIELSINVPVVSENEHVFKDTGSPGWFRACRAGIALRARVGKVAEIQD